MSIGTFFKSVEEAATKVAGFIVKQMTFAEQLLGSGTGNAKLNLVVKVVTDALDALGIPATGAEAEMKAVIDALVALFNKVGVFEAGTPPATPPPAA